MLKKSPTKLPISSLRKKNGEEHPVEMHCQQVELQGEPTTLMIARDVSERLESQAEVDRARVRLSEAQKMEAVGRLAGGVAHDFNNLLTVIGGYAELLSETEEQKELTSDMLHAVHRARDLTSQLLTFSRRHPTEPETFDLLPVFEKSMSMVSRLLPKSIDFMWEHDAAPHLVHVNPGQTEQVLLNLVINARDAIQDTGTIRAALTTLKTERPIHWTGGELRAGVYTEISVEDTGCGMSEDVQRQAFDPFYTTKPPGEGTGLGLSTVFGIVQPAGGAVLLKSELGEGSRFRILLPRQHEKQPTPKETERVQPPVQTGASRVCLVEDESSLRTLLQRTLKRAGYQVEMAGTGSDAVEAFGERATEFDFLVTDIVMPGLKGTQVAEALKRKNPRLQVIYMSGYGDGAVAEVESLDGIFLQKPFSPPELVATLGLLGGG